MKLIGRREIVAIVLCMLSVLLYGEDVSFRASAPSQVVVGKPFQIVYTVNQRGKDLRQPELDGFDVLAGPYSSTSSSTSWINGKRTSSYQQTYTYTVAANREGSFSISPATIVVDGEQYKSNGLKITVLPEDEDVRVGGGSQSGGAEQGVRSGSEDRKGDGDIFIRTILSKQKVYEQECLLLQYKLYFAGVDVTQFTNNTRLPEFKGFLKQELERGDVETELEHYNGRNYYTAVLYETLLYPQHSGDIKIDAGEFEAVLRVQTRSQVRSIFDDFFGSYTNVTRKLTAPGVKIHVESLPKGRPAGFSGGVGSFGMKSEITGVDVMQNDAVTLKIVVSGSGNIKLLKTPVVEFPEGFEEYDPKVTNNFKTTRSGMSGQKTIEYLFIPRAAGDYVIPSVEFSYFDTGLGEYKTLRTDEYKLHVRRQAGEEGSGVVSNYVGKEDIKQLGSDIRYIETSGRRTESREWIEFGGVWFWLSYVLPLLLSGVLFVVFRRQIKERADVRRMRYKKANKTAQKRLKKARSLMLEDKRMVFYEEIERAAWQYLGDRLSVETSALSKENISDRLRKRGVSEELIVDVNEVLSEAGFARYAPSGEAGAMQQMYDKTASMIDKIESVKL